MAKPKGHKKSCQCAVCKKQSKGNRRKGTHSTGMKTSIGFPLIK